MGKLTNGQKRKRRNPERFGEKATYDYSDDELYSEIDSLSNDSNFTPIKKRKLGQQMILSDDDAGESSDQLQNFGAMRNFDRDLELIEDADRSNLITSHSIQQLYRTSNSIPITQRQNRHDNDGKMDDILENVLRSLNTVTNSIGELDKKVDQIFARVSVIESKLIDRHAKSSSNSALVKDNDESRKLKMYFKANCIPFTNVEDMNRFEKNLDDSDFEKQAVSINLIQIDEILKYTT